MEHGRFDFLSLVWGLQGPLTDKPVKRNVSWTDFWLLGEFLGFCEPPGFREFLGFYEFLGFCLSRRRAPTASMSPVRHDNSPTTPVCPARTAAHLGIKRGQG
jgi:hypothetical protein